MSKTATLYRMKMPEHICPYGIKTKDLLAKQGFEVSDHPLTSREETDEFLSENNVDTTPQVFIDGHRIGGYEQTREYFGKSDKGSEVSYTPIITIFSVTLLMAIASSIVMYAAINVVRIVELFIGYSMCVLAIQKIQDLEAFSLQFVGYDILARRSVNYSYIYPFAEVYAGIGMIAMVAPLMFAPVSLFIGTVGAVSVIKAVYIEKRELKCACVGGNSRVPLGMVSLTENLMMVVMGVWMLMKMA